MTIALTSPETSAEAVLQNADIAMYRAKSQGKARSELFDRTMHEQVMSRLLLEAKLRYALQNEELTLHYQPIVAVDTGAVQGFEALLRWQPSGSNSIPPSTFVPVAEQSGLIVPISVWVLKKACLEAASWRQRYPADPPLYVSINIGFQSTRPARGATGGLALLVAQDLVSIHAPRAGRDCTHTN